MRLALLALLALAVLPCANAQVSTGTVFAVAPVLLITNHHVVDGCTAIEVVCADGRRRAAVVDADPLIDLALLRVPGMRGRTAKQRCPNNVRLKAGAPTMGCDSRASLDRYLVSKNFITLSKITKYK